MVSLWGSKKDDGQENGANGGEHPDNDGASGSRPISSRSREPNERTRLLRESNPPRRNDGYLDPDDPAVSPYNLWTVRALRYFTVLFTMLTFVWWVLLFISIFVTPPGLSTPGSGFTDFAYTTLTLGLLMMSLIFFATPSRAIRGSMSIIAILLLVDMIIILAVGRIRHEEGWVGIVSSVWIVLMSFWAVLTDRVVTWGKHEEEERLTGRAERRRTLGEWLKVFAATALAVVYIVIVVLMTATLILRALDASLEADGERIAVDSNKYKVHINCIGDVTTNPNTGKRDPTIILEAGETPSEYDFEHWAYAAWQNGTIGRYCYWDRPGYAWSDNAPSPHSAGISALALSEALAKKGEQGPWISVSAGFGSIVARTWMVRQRDVVGLMMIDPLHEDLLYRVGKPVRGFKLWGYGIISPLGIQRLGGALFKSRTKQDRVYGKSVWETGRFLKAKLQENLVADSLSKSEVSAARNIMSKKTPLVLVSSGISVRSDQDWERKQKDLSKLTDRLVSWDVVNKAPHEVWDTLDGRNVMEKRLGELFAAGKERYHGLSEEAAEAGPEGLVEVSVKEDGRIVTEDVEDELRV